MKQRRDFLRMASAAAVPAAAMIASAGNAHGDDGSVKDFLGSWHSTHSLPFPPGSFQEFLSLSDGGVLHETNSFLHTASNLDFSAFGLPNVVNGSDGAGNWERSGNDVVRIVFRKLLFNGARTHFGYLHVTGIARSDGQRMTADWHIKVLDLADLVLMDFGAATSEGTRIR